MEPCVSSACEVKVPGRSPPTLLCLGYEPEPSEPFQPHTSRAMANASVEALLQSTEIRELMEPTGGNHTQPASSQSLTKPMSVSFLGTELPMGAATPHYCGLKRTFACTDLLLLSLAEDEEADDAEEDDDADRKGPPIHPPSSMDTTKSSTPPLQREHSSPSPCPSH